MADLEHTTLKQKQGRKRGNPKGRRVDPQALEAVRKLLGNEPLRFCWLDCSLNGLRLTALLATFVVGIALFLRWRRKRPVDQSPKDDPT